MIKKSSENDLIAGMERELRSHDQKQGFENLDKAVDYLDSASQILEEAGMTAKADQVLRILAKIAGMRDTQGKPVHDPHIQGLTRKKMENNLKNHGLMFNLADDAAADDLLNVDIEQPKSFDEDYEEYLRLKEMEKHHNKPVPKENLDSDFHLKGLVPSYDSLEVFDKIGDEPFDETD
jgi:hypothetical protein